MLRSRLLQLVAVAVCLPGPILAHALPGAAVTVFVDAGMVMWWLWRTWRRALYSCGMMW